MRGKKRETTMRKFAAICVYRVNLNFCMNPEVWGLEIMGLIDSGVHIEDYFNALLVQFSVT